MEGKISLFVCKFVKKKGVFVCVCVWGGGGLQDGGEECERTV